MRRQHNHDGIDPIMAGRDQATENLEREGPQPREYETLEEANEVELDERPV